MDALKFAKAQRRMCETYPSCGGCPMNDMLCCQIGSGNAGNDISDEETIIDIVEEWAKTHPANTRQSEFMKIFPNPDICSGTGAINICPTSVDTNFECSGIMVCADCKKKYWFEEIE